MPAFKQPGPDFFSFFCFVLFCFVFFFWIELKLRISGVNDNKKTFYFICLILT